MTALQANIQSLLGLGIEGKDLTFLEIALRGLVVFFVALVLVRISDRRALTKKSPFDIILVVILGSVLARAVNGSSSFWPTLGGAALLVLLHRGLAFVSCRWPIVCRVIKGKAIVIIEDGRLQEETMRKQDISRADVMEDLRLSAKTEELADIKVARLEANGDLSFIKISKSAA